MDFRLNLKKPPLFLTVIIVILFCFSMVEMYSLSSAQFTPRCLNHLLHITFSLFIFFATSIAPIEFWKRTAYIIYLSSLLLLLAVSVFGKEVLGAQRWLDLKFITLQPAEIMRTAMVLVLARYFSNITLPDIRYNRYLIGSTLLLLIPVALVLKQPDLGTAMLLIFTYVTMLFIAGVQYWKIASLPLTALIATPFIWSCLHDYQKDRILIFLRPETDPNGAGYHIIQSKIALGSGGVFGLGSQHSTQCQLDFLPEKYTDFIFSAIGEKFGFIGCLIIITLYILLLLFNYKIAIKAKDKFSKYLAFGLNAMIFFYIFINISMICGIVPIVGVPLPFLSYGGSALSVLMFSEGLIISIINSNSQKS